MRFLVFITAVLGLLLGACAQNGPKESTPAATLEPAFYDSIRERAPRYFTQINTKVLAVCINWQNSTPRRAAIDYWTSYFTAIGSTTVPSRDLRQSAMLNCNDAKVERILSCDCAVAAVGNEFILEPSAEQLALLGGPEGARRKFAARQEAYRKELARRELTVTQAQRRAERDRAVARRNAELAEGGRRARVETAASRQAENARQKFTARQQAYQEDVARRAAAKQTARRLPPAKIRFFSGTGTWEGTTEELDAGAMLVRRGSERSLNLTLGDDVCWGTYRPTKADASEVAWSVYCRKFGPISGNARAGKDDALSAVGEDSEGRLISFEMRSEL